MWTENALLMIPSCTTVDERLTSSMSRLKKGLLQFGSEQFQRLQRSEAGILPRPRISQRAADSSCTICVFDRCTMQKALALVHCLYSSLFLLHQTGKHDKVNWCQSGWTWRGELLAVGIFIPLLYQKIIATSPLISVQCESHGPDPIACVHCSQDCIHVIV